MKTMTTLARELPSDLILLSGSHEPDGQMCIMEAAAYVAGEPWTDRPQCVCPMIAAFLRSWNDSIRDDAHRTALLKPLIPKVVGSRSTPAVELQRSYLAFDWLVRVQVPAWLDLTPSLKASIACSRFRNSGESDPPEGL